MIRPLLRCLDPGTGQLLHALSRLADCDITFIDVHPAAGRALAAPLAQARVQEKVDCERLVAHGFSEAFHVEGGMEAWANEVDNGASRH